MLTTPEALAAELLQKGLAAHKSGNVVIKTAADIQRDAKIMAPVDTGNLKASITRESRRFADGSAESVVGPEAAYGHFVESGTVHTSPQPYLLPAAMRHEEAFYDALADIVGFSGTPSLGTATVLPGGG